MTQQFEISKKDSLGGLRLENTQLSQWQCPDASIKNLDLWNAPHLTKLDLSLCLPGMHLMLVNCPKITEIILRWCALLFTPRQPHFPQLNYSRLYCRL